MDWNEINLSFGSIIWGETIYWSQKLAVLKISTLLFILLHYDICMVTQPYIHKMEQFVEIFKALSDETRVRILSLLISSKESICVCEIVDALEEPQYNVSRHLKVLKNAGLVEENKKGRWKYFSLTRKKDLFTTHLLKTITSIPAKAVRVDSEKLKKRLEVREKGECVMGIQNAHLSSRR